MATKKQGRPTKGNEKQVTQMMEPVAEIPSLHRGRASQWDDTIAALRKKPGKPFLIAECEDIKKAGAVAQRVRQLATRTGGQWKVASRDVYVYASFLGDD